MSYSYKEITIFIASLVWTVCLASITSSLHILASPPPQSSINELLSVGYTLTDPEGHEVYHLDE
jgi:hypothetical protein